MAKKARSKTKSVKPVKPVKWDDPMTGAMKFFLSGLIAEFYLLIVNRFYINGAAVEMINWHDKYLKVFIGVGAAIMVAGLAMAYLWRAEKAKSSNGVYTAMTGAFIAISSGLVLWNMNILSILTTLVPVVMLLGILWNLYDRISALSLTTLGAALFAVWLCRRNGAGAASLYIKAIMVLLLVLIVVLIALTKTGKLNSFLDTDNNFHPIYLCCGISIVAVAISLVSMSSAYYMMWALGVIIFALAVYYTVKQL